MLPCSSLGGVLLMSGATQSISTRVDALSRIRRTMAAQLSQAGIPVAASNTLKYFWQEREPDAAAHDLARISEHYVSQWHGSDEQKSVCEELPRGAGRNVVLPGGHHFNGNYAALVDVILDRRKAVQ